MKSKRLTILCVAGIALIGTPRAWQEIGNLLAVAQQKAQMKFWSMVMRPAAAAEVELVAVAEEPAPEHDTSTCALQRGQEPGTIEPVSYGEPRVARRATPRPKAAARRRQAADGAAAAGLIAHARKLPKDKQGVEPVLSFDELKDSDFDFSEVAENVPAPPPARAAKARPHPRPSDTLSFVELPTMAPVAAALSDKEVAYQFKLLKKPLIDSRVLRHRGRIPAVRVSTSFPAS